MVAVFRLFGLMFLGCIEHLKDGLAWPAILIALLLGWRGFRVWWALIPSLMLAGYASALYSAATGEGKISGAMGNFVFEAAVFVALSLAFYLIGRLIGRKR